MDTREGSWCQKCRSSPKLNFGSKAYMNIQFQIILLTHSNARTVIFEFDR